MSFKHRNVRLHSRQARYWYVRTEAALERTCVATSGSLVIVIGPTRRSNRGARIVDCGMGSTVVPMRLATLHEPFDHPDWIFKLKYDGVRAIAERDEETIRGRLSHSHPSGQARSAQSEGEESCYEEDCYENSGS